MSLSLSKLKNLALGLTFGLSALACSRNHIEAIELSNAADGAVLWKSEVPEGGIYTVDFNQDGSTVVAAGFDGDVRLLSATDGKLLKKFTPVEIKPAVAAK